MADNVEQFLIKFGFRGKEALEGLKKISQQYDKITAKAQKRASVEAAASKSVQSNLKKEANALLRQQNSMRISLRQAEKLGISTKFYERSLSSAKKSETVARRRLELQELITKEQLRQTKASKMQTAAVRQTAAAEADRISKLKFQTQQLQSSRRRQASERERVTNQMSILKYDTPHVKSLETAAPQEAARLLKKAQDELVRSGGRITPEYRKIRRSIRDTATAMNKAQRSALGLKTAQRGIVDSTRNMIRSYASLFAVLAATRSINKVGQGFEAMNSAMLAAMGTKEEAAKQIAFLDQLTSKLGLSLLDTSDQYTKFIFASKGKLPTEEVNYLFKSLAEMGTVLGVSKERMKLSFVAIQQMMNKNVVQSEELKRQLAESLPGAIQLFARAMKVEEQELFKMMESGQVLAEDVLPKVAREMAKVANTGGALEIKLKTTRIAQGRFNKELETTRRIIFDSGFDKGGFDFFNTLAETLKENTASLEAIGKIFKTVFHLLESGIKVVTPILSNLFYVVGETLGVFDGLFGDGAGNWVYGIGLVAGAVKVLGNRFAVISAIVTTVTALLGDIFAIFQKGKVGSLEYILGKDLAIEVDSGAGGIAKILTALAGLAAMFATFKVAVNMFKTAIATLLSGLGMKSLSQKLSSSTGKSGGGGIASRAGSALGKKGLIGAGAGVASFLGLLAMPSELGNGMLTEEMKAKIAAGQLPEGTRAVGGNVNVNIPIAISPPEGADSAEIANLVRTEVKDLFDTGLNLEFLSNAYGGS